MLREETSCFHSPAVKNRPWVIRFLRPCTRGMKMPLWPIATLSPDSHAQVFVMVQSQFEMQTSSSAISTLCWGRFSAVWSSKSPTNERPKHRDLHIQHIHKIFGVFFCYDLNFQVFSFGSFSTPADSIRLFVLMSSRKDVSLGFSNLVHFQNQDVLWSSRDWQIPTYIGLY